MWEGIDHVLGLSGNPVLPGAVEATAGGTHTRRGLIPGTLHTSVGQEAQVVGACMALRPHDNMTGNHRSHGHPIGKATGARIGGVRYTDRLTGQRHALGAPVVVNAAGPWVDAVLSHDGKTTRRFVGGTKGSHLVVNPSPGAPRDVVYCESQSDGRLVLVIPWGAHYVIGTTGPPLRQTRTAQLGRAGPRAVAVLKGRRRRAGQGGAQTGGDTPAGTCITVRLEASRAGGILPSARSPCKPRRRWR